MLYDCLWRTVLRGIVLRHTVLAKFFGTIAGGASGLSRIGTMADGQPDGFYVIVVVHCTGWRFAYSINKKHLK